MRPKGDENDRTITTEHTLYECTVGPLSCGDDVRLFRAPVVLDGSGTYKRLPHEIKWEHVQVGDVLIALQMHDGPSGQGVIDILQFWNVVRQENEDCFVVQVNNIVGMAAYGDQVYDQIARLAGSGDATT